MTRLKGWTSLTIVVVIIFALLVVGYHLLSNEVDDISTGKIHSYLKGKDLYDVNDITEALEIRKTQNSEILGDKFKIDERYRYGGSPLFTGHKIVHLDLKGAPPKVTYFEYLFRLLKTLGATGILMEYEDMFPFEGNLIDIGAGNRYFRKEIYKIQNLAEENDMTVIPLIQTFGHLEFILKLEKYKDLREMYRYPQSICPTHNKSLPLLFEMIDQVIVAHPSSKYLHIGADEVYQLGECTRCMDAMAKHKWGKRQLFLNHVTKVAKYIKEKYPHITILMWDDEFREIESQVCCNRSLIYYFVILNRSGYMFIQRVHNFCY